MELKNKVALVTGGSQGIGRAFCEYLVKAGCKVAICDLNHVLAEKLAQTLETDYGPNVSTHFCLDVSDSAQFEEVFQRVLERFQRIDIVVNNAGILDDSPEGWRRAVDVNLCGAIQGSLLAVKFLGKQNGGKGATIVLTSSLSGVHRDSIYPIYSACKAGLNYLARSLGSPSQVNLTGVRVMSICPGLTNTLINQNLLLNKTILPGSQLEALSQDRAQTMYSQRPETVAECLINMLNNGSSGSVWAVLNDSYFEIDYSLLIPELAQHGAKNTVK